MCCLSQGHTRALSLRALKELLKYQPCRFSDYAELTIMKVLDAHKDPVKEVRYSTVRYGTVRYGTVRYGTVRYGTVRYGTVRYGTV